MRAKMRGVERRSETEKDGEKWIKMVKDGGRGMTNEGRGMVARGAALRAFNIFEPIAY